MYPSRHSRSCCYKAQRCRVGCHCCCAAPPQSGALPRETKGFFFLGGGGHGGSVWEGAAGALRHAPSTRNVVGVDVCYVLLRVWMVAVVCVCVRGGAAAYGSLCVATFLYGQAARPLP